MFVQLFHLCRKEKEAVEVEEKETVDKKDATTLSSPRANKPNPVNYLLHISIAFKLLTFPMYMFTETECSRQAQEGCRNGRKERCNIQLPFSYIRVRYIMC